MSSGTGSLYQRGEVWWISYSFRGERHRESSGSTRKKDAKKLLRQRIGEMGDGGPKVHEEEVMFEDLAEKIKADYKMNDRATLSNLKTALKHLRGHFGGWRAVDITKGKIRKYITSKQDDGYSNGYIRRHLANLKTAFNLAVDDGDLSRVPAFPSLNVDNTRTNFLTMEDVEAICEEISDELVPVVRFAAYTGWRKGEIIPYQDNDGLRWRQVDFSSGTVHLDPGQTKNDEGRTFPFSALPPLEELLRSQRDRTDEVEREQGRIVRHVFHRDGRPIKWMRHEWNDAAEEAGMPEAWFHDLRRTAVRNLERAGVPRSVATKLTGHETESIYRRYAIADESALEEGVEKLAAFHEDRDGEGKRSAVSLDKARNS